MKENLDVGVGSKSGLSNGSVKVAFVGLMDLGVLESIQQNTGERKKTTFPSFACCDEGGGWLMQSS
jgi:hypothetical protein